MENKIIEMTIDELDDETRVEKISFVDDPAIKREWLAFQKHGQAFKIQSEEKRIVSGALMVADLPIFRRSKTGEEYYVVSMLKPLRKSCSNSCARVGFQWLTRCTRRMWMACLCLKAY